MSDSVRWLDENEMTAWRAFIRAHGTLVARLDQELQAEHHLGLPEYEVLVHLSEAERRELRMTDLARRVLLSPSGMTRRLDGLVRRGLVERRRCPSDGRGQFAVLTTEGLTAMEHMAPTHVRGVREHFVDRLTRQQLRELVEIFSPIAGDRSGGPEIASAEGADGCGQPPSAGDSRFGKVVLSD